MGVGPLVPSTLNGIDLRHSRYAYSNFHTSDCYILCPALQGEKVQYGHIAIGTPGDDENAKRFLSLHAVQRHMVDRNQCKMAFEDNEGEYDDFYEYGEELSAAGASECQHMSAW